MVWSGKRSKELGSHGMSNEYKRLTKQLEPRSMAGSLTGAQELVSQLRRTKETSGVKSEAGFEVGYEDGNM